jgi:dTMP kinase
MSARTRGLLVVIEGIDGSGKSTLARSLHAALAQAGHKTILTKEPGDTELGKELRTILQTQTSPVCSKAEYLLFAADRAQHFEDLIIPKLREECIIISDRMADSSVAYQGYGRGLDVDMIKKANAWAMSNMQPDITFYVRITVEESKKRIAQRGNQLTAFERERDDFLKKLVTGFDEIFAHKSGGIILDGTQSPDALVQEALAHITKAQQAR